LYAVPFENLSIHTGEKIRLDEGWLYEKIVARRRGGFCYECNGLFAWLLRRLGYGVTLHSARVRSEGEGYGAPFDHLALRVALDEPWLVDVGFGEGFREPLRWNERGEQSDGYGAYRLEERDGELLYSRLVEGAWQPQYLVDPAPRRFEEFGRMCHYHQTSWQSPFTRKTLCSLALPEGRITLSGDQLIETRGSRKQEKTLVGDEVIEAALAGYFGVEIKLGGSRGSRK
jgi:N-hydroxyarylamine O-acetyltransferase